MTFIYLSVFVYALFFILSYYSWLKPTLEIPQGSKKGVFSLTAILATAFILRIILACVITGHTTDISCFKSWACMAFEDGLNNFYVSEAFTDYPPGYMYVLWLLGALKSVFDIGFDSGLYTLIIKLPAIICDIITGWFLYNFLQKRTNTTLALCIPFLYIFNPAVIINSAAWGQVDSVFTLFVVLFIYYITEKKLLSACIYFTIGFLIKPQTIIFTPILLVYLYQILFMNKHEGGSLKRTIKEIVIAAVSSVALLFILILPFAKNFDFMPIIKQYIATLSSYPYASVNAFNVFALFGGTWRDVNTSFMLLSYSAWSNIAIVSIVVVCGYIFIKQKGETNLFMLGAFIITAMFTLAAKMHERYVFPAMILLAMAFLNKKDTRILFVSLFLSIGQFLNTAIMLHQNLVSDTTAPPEGAFVPIVCLINIATFIYLTYVMFTEKEPDTALKEKKKAVLAKTKNQKQLAEEFKLMESEKKVPITRIDVIIMAAVTLVYAVVAFTNLGDMKTPITKWNSPTAGVGIQVNFEDNTRIEKMKWFTGSVENRPVDFYITTGDDIVVRATQSLDSVLSWHEYEFKNVIKEIKIVPTMDNTSIHELAFEDENGVLITPKTISALENDCGIEHLFDEQDTVPYRISFKNGTYFDEIYHARTGYEYINALNPYENTHPPLGKIFIALGMILFGANPFGWRFMGTLFGVMMLPCIYIFAKKLFKNTGAAAVAIILLAADFMHFAQTRIATIDVYITFFIILMYYFMYDYTTKSFYDTPFKKTLIPLAASGVCMGLGIASKWTGVYAAIGLAIMFFISLGRRIKEYRQVMSNPHSSKAMRKAVEPCKKYCRYTILWCILFFVLVPFAIYCLSYIPYLRAPGMKGFVSIIENQFSMFLYHSRLTEGHPFSSQWYQWPIIARPIWYYSGIVSEGVRSSIASFGNPFVWWTGIGAFVYSIYKLFKKKNYNALFLIIGFLAQYLPWVGVSRIVFIYHYFTCVPFIVLMISSISSDLLVRYPYNGLTLKNNRAAILICIYCFVCILAFIAFYPVLSGMNVDSAYLDSLRWYKTWTF